jgi:hypothetical protein
MLPNGQSPLYVTKSSNEGHHGAQRASSLYVTKSSDEGHHVAQRAKSVVRDKVLR